MKNANFFRSFPHKHKALSVRDDLRGIQRLFQVVDELLLALTAWFLRRSFEDSTCSNTLILHGRQATCKDSLADQGD